MADFRVRAKVEGIDPLLRRLQAFPEKVRKKVLRQAVTAGIRIVNKDAKKAARRVKETGLLAKSIGTKVKAYGKGAKSVVAMSGPRKGFRQVVMRSKGKWAPAAPKPSGFADPVKYAHLVEKGTKRSRATWFLRDALRNNASAVADKMAEIIRAGIQREAATAA